MIEKTERTIYESTRHHWDEVLATLRHIVTQFADEAVEVAARAVMLMAPMPNAISVFNITQVQQGFSQFQAFAFSMTIEIVIFFLIEIALLMLSRWLERKPVYRWAFIGMCVVVLAATGIVIRMVYVLEPHKVMAWLPVISLCSFVAIGLKRWDARNLASGVKAVKPAMKQGVKFDTSARVDSVNFAPTKVDTRRQSLLKMLEEIDGQGVDSLNKSALAKRLDVSRPTLISDIAALQDTGQLTLNGHVKIRKMSA